MYDRKLSGTESNAGELQRLKQQLKDLRSRQNVATDKQVPIGEHLENQMSKFIGRIIANEAIQNNQRRS
jgi:hypothetical protein